MKDLMDRVLFDPQRKLRTNLGFPLYEIVEELDKGDIPTGIPLDYLEYLRFSFVRYFVDLKDKNLLT
jgi:hypothetical protein